MTAKGSETDMTHDRRIDVAEGTAFVTGDVHGNIYDFDARIEYAKVPGGSCVVIAGDAGIAYGQPHMTLKGSWRHDMERLDHLEQICAYHDVIAIVMRGNHDVRYCRDIRDELFGDFEPMCDENGSYLTLFRAPHLLFASDRGGAYRIGGRDVLMIPGAYSVDKAIRLYNGLPWEAEEQLDSDELARLEEMSRHIPFDAVISHTCPSAWQAKMPDLLIPGLRSVDHTMEMALDRILANVGEISADNAPRWFFGHYHDDREITGTMGRLLYHDVVAL